MKGTCLCGGVAFEISAKVPNLYQCHCSQCRQQGGSTSNTATIVQQNQFSWISGESLVTQFKHSSGFNSHFCSVCGCPVPNPLRNNLVWVPAGLLQDSDELEIVAHLFVGSKAHWENTLNPGRQFEEMPGLDALVEVLNR